MNEAEKKEHIRKTFDSVSNDYDCHALRFFANAAAQLPRLFEFNGDEQVLEAACGTGTPAMAMAIRVFCTVFISPLPPLYLGKSVYIYTDM